MDRVVLGVDPIGDVVDLRACLEEALVDSVVETVERVEPADLEGVDCVVCRADPATDRFEALSAVRAVDSELPVVVAASSGRVDAALDAGATEVIQVVDGSVPERALANRIESVLRDREASVLRGLQEVTADPEAPFEERVRELLAFGADQLGMSVGFLSRVDVDADEFEFVATHGDHETIRAGDHYDLSETYCRHLLADGDGTLEVADATEAMAGDPAYEAFGLGCYLGAEIVLDGEPYGTLCFADETPRERPVTERERTLVELIAQWVREEIQRRRHRREREATATRLEATIERIGDAFFAIDDEWRVTHVNEAGARVLGEAMDLPADEERLVGRSLLDEIPEVTETRFYDHYARALDRQETVTFEEYYEPLDRWFDVTAYPDEGGLSVYFADVTERRERERTLEQYRTLTETLSDVILTVDDAGTVQSVNPAIEDLLGYEREAVLGESLTTIMPDRLVDVHEAAFQRYLETGERRLDWEYVEIPGLHSDGHEVPLAVSFSEYEHGADHYFTAVIRDVTEREERERRLNDLLDATQRFHRVSDRDELLDRTIEAVQEVFDRDLTAVRRHDPEAGTLRPVRVSDNAPEPVPALPTHDDDARLTGRAFQSGEPVVVDDMERETDHDYGLLGSGVVLPLGDHGTLAVGALDTEAFDPEEVALLELLAVAATEALDRLDREAETYRLRRILDHVEEMVFLVDREGAFTFVTDQFADYLGRERSDLEDASLLDVLAAGGRDTCERKLATLRGSEGGERLTVEVDLLAADGTPLPVELELSTTGGDEVAGAVTDISELEATRSSLAVERERFRELLENIPDPVVEVKFQDGTPVVEYVNPAFTDVFGFAADAVEGENLNDFVVPEGGWSDARTIDERAASGERVTVEVQRETTDGLRDFLLRGIPYSRGGETYGFGVYTDITEQRKRERYLQVLNRVLRHNLRNDLTVAILEAEHLARQVDEQLAERAWRLRDDLEAVAALSEKARETERVVEGANGDGPVDAAAHLRSVVEECRDLAPEATIDLSVPDRLWVRGDEGLRRGFEEVVENALVHAGPEPSVAIETVTPDREGWVEIHVRDDGPGIPDDEWEVVVGDAEITQLKHGSGLGLWLTKWAVESCGGELRCEATAEGSTVVLALRRTTASGDQ